MPYAFTEQDVAMLSSVLNSQRAIQVNIQIMRTFTKLRELLATGLVRIAKPLGGNLSRQADDSVYALH